jgi:hypothetical protein
MALVIALTIFISLVLLSKGYYHWQYLRQVDIRYQSCLSDDDYHRSLQAPDPHAGVSVKPAWETPFIE